MTDGGLTMKQAARLQTFIHVKNCRPSRVKAYKAIHPPRCNNGYGCGACLLKWVENLK